MKSAVKLLKIKETLNKLNEIKDKVVLLPDSRNFNMLDGQTCVLGALYAPLEYTHVKDDIFNFCLSFDNYHHLNKYQKKVFHLFNLEEKNIFSYTSITKQEWLEKCEEVLLYLERKIKDKEGNVTSLVYVKDLDTNKYLAYDGMASIPYLVSFTHHNLLEFYSTNAALDFIKTQKVHKKFTNLSLEVFQTVDVISVPREVNINAVLKG